MMLCVPRDIMSTTTANQHIQLGYEQKFVVATSVMLLSVQEVDLCSIQYHRPTAAGRTDCLTLAACPPGYYATQPLAERLTPMRLSRGGGKSLKPSLFILSNLSDTIVLVRMPRYLLATNDCQCILRAISS